MRTINLQRPLVCASIMQANGTNIQVRSGMVAVVGSI